MSARNIARFHEWGRKIVGVSLNYSQYRGLAEQLGETFPLVPRLFCKPASSYITHGKKIQISDISKQGLWYEIELGLVIGKNCKKVSPEEAMQHVAGYVTVLDMTCPESYFQAREHHLPWTICKGFDTSTPVGDFVPKEMVPDPQNLNLWLKLNGKMRQEGNTNDMNFSLPNIVSFISDHFTLDAGDLVITGTPVGVDKVRRGDVIEAGIDHVGEVKFEVE